MCIHHEELEWQEIIKVIENVAIIILLPVEQAIDRVLFPFSAKVVLHPGIYLERVQINGKRW